jgi:hypothetical protein
MDQAATFLSASILMALGVVVLISAAVAVNNLLHKFWKPVKIFSADSWSINPPPAMEKVTPSLDKAN